ncbi:MAG: hypothetical protein ABW212_11295 [Pseudonocardia sediminis]
MYRNPVTAIGAAAQIAYSPDRLVDARRDVGSEQDFRMVHRGSHSGLVAT